MLKNFIILTFFISTVVFGILFIIYYNRLDQFKKEKVVYLKNKEEQLNIREKQIEKIEQCSEKLKHCTTINDGIKKLLATG